jgi:PAS domain S-box-containing protein
VRARQLADLTRGAAPRTAPAGVGFMPLVRGALLPGRQLIYVVALLNLDAFANFQQVTVNDERAASALLTYSGQLVAATAGVPHNPGDDLAALPPYTAFLPQHEQGQWVGAGLRPGAQIAAFKVSATRPLVAWVEIDRSQALAGWFSGALRLLAAGVAAVLLIGAMTALAARSLRAREQARAELDRAQQQVARRERELRVTIASLQEMIFRTDASGAITFVNERWADYTATAPETAAGRYPWDLVVPADRLAARALFAAARDTGARRLQTAIQTPGGLRWFDVSVMPLQQGGRLVGFAGSAIDVTESRTAEQATREARDAAEEASRAKSEFIANISHELRTPLQSIIGFSELGQMRSREQAKLGAMFGDIHSAGQRMLNLVNDLLDVAKIESTVGTMNLERSDLRGLVRGVAGQLAPQLAARRLQLGLALPEYPLRAKVDPMRFEQVLRNVLANAIKFSPVGGRITVSGDQTDAGELHLAISDEGPGIPPAELDSIFEAFVQSSHTKDGSGGTGLGLAICRKIVIAHGGRIHAENRPGGGAVFHIQLPARGASETLPAPL